MQVLSKLCHLIYFVRVPTIQLLCSKLMELKAVIDKQTGRRSGELQDNNFMYVYSELV